MSEEVYDDSEYRHYEVINDQFGNLVIQKTKEDAGVTWTEAVAQLIQKNESTKSVNT